MLKLYFGTTTSIISTLMIIVFGIFSGLVLARRSTVTHWGLLVLIMFFFGLFMSMMSGFKDGMGTPASIIPNNHWMMAALCILGGLCFIIAIVTLFIRKQDFWQVSFFILCGIIAAKVILTEGFRIVHLVRHLS